MPRAFAAVVCATAACLLPAVVAARVGDGGASDDDHQADSTLRAALSTLTPLGESPAPPERLRPDDLLLVLDPQTLVYLTARLRS